MDGDPTAHQQLTNQLTESQRRCLRLVLAPMTSKEIGRELRLSPHTVDAHTKAAMKTLGMGSRVEAARWLAEMESPAGEATPSYQSLVHQQLGMVTTFELEEINHISERLTLVTTDVDYTDLVETNHEWKSNLVHDTFTGTGLTIRTNEGILDLIGKSEGNDQDIENKLSKYKRIMIIIAICISSILVTALAMPALSILSGLYK